MYEVVSAASEITEGRFAADKNSEDNGGSEIQIGIHPVSSLRRVV